MCSALQQERKLMSNAEGTARVAFDLDAGRRAAAYTHRSATWEKDYGQNRDLPKLVREGYHDGSGRNRNGSGNARREGWTYRRVFNLARGLWLEMMEALCPGTRVLIICAGIAAFIVVV